MAELRSNEVLAKMMMSGQALCLLDKVCPQDDIFDHAISHNITSYISYDGATSSYYHAYNGYVYINDVQIDSLQECIFQGSGWTFTGEVDSYNRIYLSGSGPTTTKGADVVQGEVKLKYKASSFKDYIIPCKIPNLNNYICPLIKVVCGDFTLTNRDVTLQNLITLTTDDKSYSIDIQLDYTSQTIGFYEDDKYNQSVKNYNTINNKYFKTHPISLYLYTIPAYYM